ncbi:hypothetical protein PIB30_110637, partial [Stylosanthes scabra]|nr:hypothetical protein [Stylosanthes scabra]
DVARQSVPVQGNCANAGPTTQVAAGTDSIAPRPPPVSAPQRPFRPPAQFRLKQPIFRAPTPSMPIPQIQPHYPPSASGPFRGQTHRGASHETLAAAGKATTRLFKHLPTKGSST